MVFYVASVVFYGASVVIYEASVVFYVASVVFYVASVVFYVASVSQENWERARPELGPPSNSCSSRYVDADPHVDLNISIEGFIYLGIFLQSLLDRSEKPVLK